MICVLEPTTVMPIGSKVWALLSLLPAVALPIWTGSQNELPLDLPVPTGILTGPVTETGLETALLNTLWHPLF